MTTFNSVTSFNNIQLGKHYIFTIINKNIFSTVLPFKNKTFYNKNLPKCFSYVVFPLYVYELPGYFQCELSKVCIDTDNWYILVSAEKLKNAIFSENREVKLFTVYFLLCIVYYIM